MNKITITVGKLLFEFSSFEDWVNNATRKFRRVHLSADSVICIDVKGRICHVGKQFMRADDEGAFPVTAYEKDGL